MGAALVRPADGRRVGCKFSGTAVTRQDACGKIAVVVVRTLAFLVVRRLLGLARLGPDPDAKDVEIAVLRPQLAVVRRQGPRPRDTPTGRPPPGSPRPRRTPGPPARLPS